MGNEHWIKCSFGDVAKIRNGYAFKTQDFKKSGDVPVIKQTQLGGETVNLDNCVYVDKHFLSDKKAFILQKGDMLMGMSGSLGKICAYNLDYPALQNQRTGKIEIVDSTKTNYRFFWYYLNTIENLLLEKGKGLAVSNVSASDIMSLPFVLPPIEEQQQIVEKLDAIMPNVKQVKERLEKIPVLLKKFRQSILSSACSGKLTEGWRTDKDLTEWDERQLQDLCDIITKGASPNWQGINYVNMPGVLFVTSENVYNFELRLLQKKYLELEFNNKQKRSVLKEGDLLTNIVGASIGRTAIYNHPELANINQAVALIRLKSSYNKRFYLLYLNSPDYIAFLNKEKVDVARANISLADLKELMVPFPPIEEQQEIVRRVEKLFALADSLEAKYKQAMTNIEKIEQSVLAKAFRGELTAQESGEK